MIAARTAHPVRMTAQSRPAQPARRPARAARAVVAQAAAAPAAPAGKASSVPVTFTINKKVHWGQEVVLVGSHERLGAWSVDAGARMAWSEGHTWSTSVELPLGADLEYKFAVVDPRHPPQWETCFNRTLIVGTASTLLSGEWDEELTPVGASVSYNADDEEEKQREQQLQRAAAAPAFAAAPAPAAAKAVPARALSPGLKSEVKLPAAAEAVVGGLIEQAESAAAAVAQLVAEELVGATKKAAKRVVKPAPAPAPAPAAPVAAAPVAATPAAAAKPAAAEGEGFGSKRRGASKVQTKRGTATKASKASDSAAASQSAADKYLKYSPEQLEFLRRNGKL